MKPLKSIFFLSVILFISAAFGQQRISSNIKDITVYLTGAQVKRTGKASLVPGTNEVIFENLSNYIDQKSITLDGTGNATILSVSYRINYLKSLEKDGTTKGYTSIVDSLNDKLDKIRNEKFALDEELAMLRENRKIQETDKSIFVDDMQDAADFFKNRILDIKNKYSALIKEETSVSQKINNLNMQVNQFNNGKTSPSGEIVVTLQSTGYETASFELGYYTTNTGWSASYGLTVNSLTEPVHMDYDALVRQQTGEDWKNVRLTLSTGNPTLSGTKPDLVTWWLNLYEPINIYNYGAPADMSRGNAPTIQKDEIKSEEPLSYTTSSITRQIVNTSFEINLRYDIPSDNMPRHVRIQQYTLPATYSYYAAPKIDPNAFLQARITGWEDYNLLPGEANVFLNGSFVGKSFIDPATTSDTLDLSLGRDKDIVIKRTKLKDLSKKQTFGSSRTDAMAFTISIRNTKKEPVTIIVEDNIPVATNKAIEVTLTDSGKADYSAETGKLKWVLNLAPDETKNVQFGFSVKHPKDKIVTGLY